MTLLKRLNGLLAEAPWDAEKVFVSLDDVREIVAALTPRCPCGCWRKAQGIEAQRAETTEIGSVHESPVGNADAPKATQNPAKDGVSNDTGE